jgi:hypothetical protein
LNNRVKNADQPWVVYGHYENNELVYLGSGQVHRAFQFIKRSDNHYSWLVETALKALTVDFIKILFVTDDFNEVRFIEGRLIAEYKPRFNKNQNKLTFKDLKEAKIKISKGKSIRSCAEEIGIVHNNLRVLLKLKYCNRDYSYKNESVTLNNNKILIQAVLEKEIL